MLNLFLDDIKKSTHCTSILNYDRTLCTFLQETLEFIKRGKNL